MSKDLTIGIDLGIASCGWAVYNNDTKVNEDQGVYLFSQAKGAQERRASRSVRRLYNRTNYRELRLRRLFDSIGFDEQVKPDNAMIDKRIKGLHEKLSKQEIVNVLNFYIKQRGYIPFKEGKDGVEYHPIALREENKDKFVCEIQKQILEEEGKVRGVKNKFLWSQYKKEIKQIIETQATHYKELAGDFADKYLEIYESKRQFWEGPGGCEENQITPFGRWKTVEEVKAWKESGKSVNEKLLFEDLIGECNVYAGEKAAPIGNFYAQTFNLINDLFNLTFKVMPEEKYLKYFKSLKNGDYKLNRDGVEFIFDSILVRYETKTTAPSYKDILKIVGFSTENVGGCRTKNNNPEIHNYNVFKMVANAIRNTQPELIEHFKKHPDYFNSIIYILTVFPGVDAIYEQLDKFNKGNTSDDNTFINLLSKNSLTAISKVKTDDIQRYHSYSEKALKKYIQLMLREEANSSYVERNCEKEIASTRHSDLIKNYPKDGTITTKYIDDIIANPQVKKSLRKAIYVINQLLEQYGDDIKCIAIESNKEVLSKDAQKQYELDSLDNEATRKSARKALEERGYDANEANILKQRLLDQTDHKCIYCGKDINLDNVEVDHIIPVSISCDDSLSNKVVCCKSCNQAKGQKAPLEYIQVAEAQKDFKERVNTYAKKLSDAKISNLLFDGNTQDIRYKKRFINRNLRDTSYATSELINQIKLYIEAVKPDADIQLLAVPPKVTGIVRHVPDLQKDRTQHYHHAIDATIIAAYANTNLGKISKRVQNNPEDFWRSDKLEQVIEGGKIPASRVCPEETISYLKTIDYDNTRMKVEVKNKTQGSFGNANYDKVIKVGQDYFKIGYLKCSVNNTTNIYEMDTKTLETVFGKDVTKEVVLIQEKDKPLYQLLIDIYIDNVGKETIVEEKGKDVSKKLNPFLRYCMDVNGLSKVEDFIPSVHGIRRNAKSPIVTKLKTRTKVTNPWLIEKDNINLKDGHMLMVDKASQAYTNVFYSEKEEKYLFMPIYMNMLQMRDGKMIENSNGDYYKLMWEKYVSSKTNHEDDLIFVMKLFTNDYISFEDKKGNKYTGMYSNFEKANNQLELKAKSDGQRVKKFTAKNKNLRKIGYGKMGRKGLYL